MRRSRARTNANYAIQSTKKNAFTRQIVSHDPEDDVDPHMAADLALTKRIADKLESHYSGHPWMVKVSHAQGVAMITLPLVMPKDRYYVLHISTLKTDPGLKSVMRAGGELLERYNIPRQNFSLDDFLRARDAGPYGRSRPRLILPT